MSVFAPSLLALLMSASGGAAIAANDPPAIGGDNFVEVSGLRFADLNRNGSLDPYEDWRLSPASRAGDLVSRMTLAEKAGTLMHGTAPSSGDLGRGQGYDLAKFEALNRDRHVTSVITRLSGTPRQLAEADNALQTVARGSRLGVPVTVSTDPRNHFQFTEGASVTGGGFSQWPEVLGFAAIGDPAVTRRFAEIARQEYRAVGIQMALSPQADLSTEPRWPRINGTFGEDPVLAGLMTGAYVEGFQNGVTGLNPDSVITVVKHWVGYGASADGFDGHNYYGRLSRLDDAGFALHVRPFLDAFAAKVAGVMPTYNILEGVSVNGSPLEQVGVGFNAVLLTDILRGQYGFDGVILSDWGITRDCNSACRTNVPPQQPRDIAMPWGVEDLSITERFAKGLNAGLDQFGGVEETELLVDAVSDGLVTEARIDQSVRRVLIQKFELGLFENPFVDADHAEKVLGSSAFQSEADAAQRRALVVLERSGPNLAVGSKVFLKGVSPEAAEAAGLIPVATLADADAVVIRIGAPHEILHPDSFFGSRQHEGRLDFAPDSPDLAAIVKANASAKPTYLSVYLDRPAVLTQVNALADVLLGDFGASDAAVLDVLMGRARGEGRLPFALPSSMASVEDQSPDQPDDLDTPLYPRGFGLDAPTR